MIFNLGSGGYGGGEETPGLLLLPLLLLELGEWCSLLLVGSFRGASDQRMLLIFAYDQGCCGSR